MKDSSVRIEFPPKTPENGDSKNYLKWKSKINKVLKSERQMIRKDNDPSEEIKVYRNRPYQIGVYSRFPDHVPTVKDFEDLSPYDAIRCDDRKYLIILFNVLKVQIQDLQQ